MWDIIRGSLPEMRSAAESLMTSLMSVSRPTSQQVTGYEVSSTLELVYSGKAKLQTYEGHERTATTGPASVVVQRMSIHFPVGSFMPQVGDVATCEASTDPLLVGRCFRITQTYPVKEHATSYRVFVDEVTKGV